MNNASPVIVLACVVFAAAQPFISQRGSGAEPWVGTWFAASAARVDVPAGQAPGASQLHFNNQTLRQITHITVGGSRLRVVLTNTFGTVPLTIGAAQVALRDKDGAIVTGSNRVLTFAG